MRIPAGTWLQGVRPGVASRRTWWPASRSPPTCCRPPSATRRSPGFPRGRPVRVSVRRAGVLAVLQLQADGGHHDVGDLFVDRRDARRDIRRRSGAARRAGRVHRADGRGARVRRLPVSAGAVVNFFSETVLVGFKCGVALFLASTQLPKLFGFAAATAETSGSAWAISFAVSAARIPPR